MSKIPQKLTKAQKNKYIMSGGNECPLCGSDDIEGGFVEIDNGGAWQPVSCNQCHAEWSDVYNMVDVEMR